MECLKKRYGRTRLEKLEELMLDYIKFEINDANAWTVKLRNLIVRSVCRQWRRHDI